jgi:hypothetical protein
MSIYDNEISQSADLSISVVSVVSPGYVRTDLSRNALTATGETYARLDQATDQGSVGRLFLLGKFYFPSVNLFL